MEADMPFEKGKVYRRRSEIHGRFGGQQQGGISTPTDEPYIFLFDSERGEEFGYKDGWDDHGVYRYYGEGQRGDMKFVRGNSAVRDHIENGKDLLLFQATKKAYVRYVDCFVCTGYHFDDDALDFDGNKRRAIVFNLVPITEHADVTGVASFDEKPDVGEESDLTLEELRELALGAGRAAEERSPKESRRVHYHRSRRVREYVLRRADGVCESCETPAPFTRSDGTPYLEPHHTRQRSDGGLDHPRWVGAICPNCHREIHYGAGGDTKNRKLQDYLSKVESR